MGINMHFSDNTLAYNFTSLPAQHFPCLSLLLQHKGVNWIKVLALWEANRVSKIVTGIYTDSVEEKRDYAHLLKFTHAIIFLLGMSNCHFESLRKCKG